MSNNQLIIADAAIKQDAEGRYCLNDLHKAAGGLPKDRPANWLQNKATQELDEELTSGNPEIKPMTMKAGRYGGTFACKEMVYAYAMWVSASFHLKVIRAYDQLVNKPQPQAPVLTDGYLSALNAKRIIRTITLAFVIFHTTKSF